MRRRNIVKFAGAVAVMGLAVPEAFAEKWEFLGSSHLDGAVDHDVIHVGVKDGRFRHIQLRVKNAPVEFIRVVVHYGDGEPEQLVMRSRIGPGDRTRAIDLRGYTRFINSVEIWYAKASWGPRRPEVELFGER